LPMMEIKQVTSSSSLKRTNYCSPNLMGLHCRKAAKPI
jgi:hypothetical protein